MKHLFNRAYAAQRLASYRAAIRRACEEQERDWLLVDLYLFLLAAAIAIAALGEG